MPESRLLIKLTEIQHVEILCLKCRAVWGFARIEPPRQSLGEQTEERCVWCNTALPPNTKSALTDLRRIFRSLSDTADFAFRLVVKEALRE